MPTMQTVDQIIATSTHPVYVIDWNHLQKHDGTENLPPPVKEWLETKSPGVKIGRLEHTQRPEPQPSPRESREERITSSVFILGFNAKQADAFIADLSCSQSRLPKSPDFYIVRCAPKHLGSLIHWHILRVRQQLLRKLSNFMRAARHKPTTTSKENQHDRTRHH